MWKLSIEDDQGEKTLVNLVRDEYTIGRAETNTIRLTERNISREHARLFRRDDDWFLADRDSYNGAYVNGARVVDPVRVAHGDLVQLGDYRLEVVDEALAASRTHPTMRDGLATVTGRRDTLVNQPDRFVMVVGPAPGTEYPLTGGRMIVGRGEECDISINHASVSRVHAEVHAIGDGRYELIDKGSANGVRVNAVELQRALIDARDNIELGDVILKYVPAGDIYVPGADESHKLAAGQIAAEAFSISAQPRDGQTKLSFAVKAGAGLAVGGLLAVLGVLALGTGNAPPAAPSATPEPEVEKPPTPLEEAKRLLDGGDVFGAHAKLLELGPNSPEKDSEVYSEIEGRWADALIDAAEQESDATAKRGLLEQVTKTPAVGADRKKRAEELLNELTVAETEIEELPEAQGSTGTDETTQQATSPRASRAVKPKSTSRRPATATNRPASSPSEPKQEKPPTLVRDDPFD